MKTNFFSIASMTLLQLFLITSIRAQTPAGLMDMLVQKKLLTQREVDSLAVVTAFNEKVSSPSKAFSIGLEFRPRFEFRDGYRQLRNDTTHAACFASQRSRLDMTYTQPKFKFHTSFQDIRVWGQYGLVSTTGSLNVYEAYAETYFSEKWLVRIGRQKVELDNGRLFSASNWSQAGRSHDAINLIYNGQKIVSEFIGSFNQTSERIYETNFSPTTFTNYKALGVHFLKIMVDQHVTFTAINSGDGYESKSNSNIMYIRGTSGGRVDVEKGNVFLTVCGYYQYGKLQTGTSIAAYYFQPEVNYKFKKLYTRLGVEYMSGGDVTKSTKTSKSFVPLYGVAWKFMGNMDYFTTFPSDLKGGGLFNPYLFFVYEINKKMAVQCDAHLFYLQHKVIDKEKNAINPYLGAENDLSLKYRWNSYSTIDVGFSYMIAEKSMEQLKGGNSRPIPFSSYLMLTFKPELFSFRK